MIETETIKKQSQVGAGANMKTYHITAAPKPRMTQRDKWLKPPRKCVSDYWAFKNEVRLNKVHVPVAGSHITFVLPMPKSWSRKKKKSMLHMPHQQRPDKDNLEKALLDAIYEEDCVVWDSRVTKIWGDTGRIKII